MPLLEKTKTLFRSKFLWAGCGFLLGAIAAQHVYLYFAIEKIRVEIRTLGYPATTAEMLAGENESEVRLRTKALYEAAFNALALDEDELESLPFFSERCDLPKRGTPLSEDALTLAQITLAQNSGPLKSLHQAAKTEIYQFWVATETDEYLGQILPWYVSQRDSGRLLALESLYLAEIGELSKASESVISGLSVARIYQPFAMGLLVSVATDGYAKQAFENLINRHEVSRSDLEKLREAFERASLDNRIAFAASTEACFWNQSVNEQFSEPGYVDDPFLVFEGPVLSKLQEGLGTAWRLCKRQAAWIFGIDARTKLLAYRTATYCIEMAELPAYVASQQLQQFLDSQSGRWPSGWIIAARELNLEIFLAIVIAEGQRTASNHAVSTAAAIEMYVQDYGEFPENLHDLVPEYISKVPADPFDGKELRYTQTVEGYVVYSIGHDLKDDDGEYLHNADGRWRDVGVVIRR